MFRLQTVAVALGKEEWQDLDLFLAHRFESVLWEMKNSEDPVIRVLLKQEKRYRWLWGWDNEWAASVIEAVVNDGEISDCDLGGGSTMKRERGPNNLVDRKWVEVGAAYP